MVFLDEIDGEYNEIFELQWPSQARQGFCNFFLSLLEEMKVLCIGKGQSVIYFEDTG
jgi:hypothetical protein